MASNAVWDYDGACAISSATGQLVPRCRRACGAAAPPIALGWTACGWATWPAPPRSSRRPTAWRRRPGASIPPFATRIARRSMQGREAEASAAIADDRRASHRRAARVSGEVRPLGGRGPLQRPRPLRGGGGSGARPRRTRSTCSSQMWALPELVEAAAREGDASSHAKRSTGWRRRRSRAAPTGGLASRLAAGAAERRRAVADDLYREAIDRLGRTGLRSGARPRPSPLRGVAAPRGPPRRRARAAAHGHDVCRDRHGGVRRARPPRVGRDGRDGAQAQRRDARRAHPARGADRPARARRPLEPGPFPPPPGPPLVPPPRSCSSAPHLEWHFTTSSSSDQLTKSFPSRELLRSDAASRVRSRGAFGCTRGLRDSHGRDVPPDGRFWCATAI